MFLRRIQVPNFRALKDVDITFEPEFSPHIFPLGSLNGGGKSTLLQLIFVLLSCSGDSEKHIFIQNMLDGFEVEEKEEKTILATIYLIDDERDLKLQFFCHTNEILIYEQEYQYENEQEMDFEMGIPGDISSKIINFSSIYSEKEGQDKILELEKKQKYLKNWFNNLKNIKDTKYDRGKVKLLKKEMEDILEQLQFKDISFDSFSDFLISRFKGFIKSDMNPFDIVTLIDDIVQEILHQEEDLRAYAKKINLEKDKVESKLVLNYIKNKNWNYICNYMIHKNNHQEYALLCDIESLDRSEINQLFKRLSTKLFLAAPFTQVFLFLPKDRTKLLFQKSNNRENYYSTLEETKRKLPNLFTYDILAVDFIIESFKAARDKDFQQAIESGEYGDAYKSILKELNSLLGNKKINIDSDLSGVNFKIDRNGENQELYPEDLSHGELKRLSIYVWLKYKNIEDSIVLMDEIENAFHPDWQYQIISDLAEWGASNQYILATHSYELCQALTPAHVKELEPRLLAEKQK